jgi:hypothetical protein
MSYVGRGLNQTGGQYRKLDDISSGFDGDATGFSLTVDNLEVTPTAQNLMISINGVIQDPGTAFTVVGSTITFTGAPASSSDFFGVVMGEASYIAYGTVGANEVGVTAGAVSASKGVVVDSSKNIQGINQVTATQFVGGGSGITGVTAEWDGTHTGDGTITGNFNVTGNITGSNFSGSSSSTASFGRVEGTVDFGDIVIDADEIPIAKLASDNVNFGGITVALGASDTTPAFALADATGLPIVAGTTGTLSVEQAQQH